MKKLLKKVIEIKDKVWTLAIVDFKIRYAGSYLGLLWSLIEPLILIISYSIIFPLILKVNFVDWFLFFVCGLIPYRYLRKGILELTRCFTDYSHILVKSDINLETIILVKAISTTLSFFIELSIILLLISFFVSFSIYILLLPIIIFISFLIIIGFGLYFSVLYLQMRDLNYILTIIFEILLFLTPIVYRIEDIPSLYRGVYMLNPITILIYLYQGILLYSSPKFIEHISIVKGLIILLLFSFVLCIIGYKKFKKEKRIVRELI